MFKSSFTNVLNSVRKINKQLQQICSRNVKIKELKIAMPGNVGRASSKLVTLKVRGILSFIFYAHATFDKKKIVGT